MKKIYDILSSMIMKTVTVDFSVPALAAGASGYWTIPHGLNISDVSKKTKTVRLRTASISGLSGLQVTVVGLNDTNIYAEYYAPKAISFGRVNASAHSVTTTGCKIRLFNGDSANRAPGAWWIAHTPERGCCA